jgi:hypothetical protein
MSSAQIIAQLAAAAQKLDEARAQAAAAAQAATQARDMVGNALQGSTSGPLLQYLSQLVEALNAIAGERVGGAKDKIQQTIAQTRALGN